MKKAFSHITHMEDIMTRQEKNIEKLDAVLRELDGCQKDYEALSTYYYSERRMQDLEDEENHRIPDDLKRGVLSEDEVYNLFLDTHDAAIHMMETALRLLKTN